MVVAALLDFSFGAAAQPLSTDSLRRVTIVFTGDLMQHLPQVQAARNGEGYDWNDCFEYVAPLLRKADIAVTNLETTLSYKGPYSGYPAFKTPVQIASAMREAGFDVALNANNHICDGGERGIKTTIAVLDSLGIRHTGAYVDKARSVCENPLIVECNGLRIALLNATYGTNGIAVPKGTMVDMLDTVAMARQLGNIGNDKVDAVIALLHWGNEYQRRPSTEQRKMKEWCNRNGIAIVIGSHPHVVQPIEIARDPSGRIEELTVWSMGNFVSNQSDTNTDGGLMVLIELQKREDGTIDITTDYTYVWRYRTTCNGRPKYYIVPRSAADTVLADDRGARERFDRFVRSQEQLLGEWPQ